MQAERARLLWQRKGLGHCRFVCPNPQNASQPMRRGMLQRVDVLHQGTYGFQALGLAELDVEALFDVADKLRHVQRVDAQLVERCVFRNLFRLDVEVLVQDLLQGINGCNGCVLSLATPPNRSGANTYSACGKPETFAKSMARGKTTARIQPSSRKRDKQ